MVLTFKMNRDKDIGVGDKKVHRGGQIRNGPKEVENKKEEEDVKEIQEEGVWEEDPGLGWRRSGRYEEKV